MPHSKGHQQEFTGRSTRFAVRPVVTRVTRLRCRDRSPLTSTSRCPLWVISGFSTGPRALYLLRADVGGPFCTLSRRAALSLAGLKETWD